MRPSDEGFLFPEVDDRLCIDCGVCAAVCPQNHPVSRNRPLAVYAGWSRDTLVRTSSSSGGAFRCLAESVMMAGGVGGAYFGAKASVNFAADLRADMYSKIQSYAFSDIDKFSTGSLVTRLTNDVTKVQNFVNMLLRMALRSPGMMVAALVMAIMTKPSLSIIFAVTMPMLALAIIFISKITLPMFTKMQAAVDDLNSDVQENITNVRVVKSFVREDFEIEKFGRANKRVKDTNFDAMKLLIYLSPAMTLFMNLTVMAVIYFGGPIVLRGEMLVGDLSAFITYVTQILSGLMMVSFLFMTASRVSCGSPLTSFSS